MNSVVVCAAVACALLGAPSGRIAFVAGTEQEDQCVAVLDAATGEITRVGPGSRDGAPVWSPDGQWLAFQTSGPDGLAVCVVRADGSERRLLTHARGWNHAPRWSPDGKRLAYASDADMGIRQQVMVYDLERNTETAWGGEGALALRPVWLPTTDLMQALDPESQSDMAAELLPLKEEAEREGALLAVGLPGGESKLTSEIVLMTPARCVPMLPLLVKDSFRFAEWFVEPDRKGRQIAYESNDGGDREIFVIGRKGITNVSNHRAADWNPVWSEDGQWLAFESFRDGRRGVHRVLVGTANVTPVAVRPNADCWAPSWSPDGEWIAHVSDETGTPQLFATPPQGGDSVQLTRGPGFALAPAWQPKVKKD